MYLHRELRVFGEPAPQGSKRVFNNRIVEVSKKVKPWRAAIEECVIKAGYDTLAQPLSVRITFLMQRPMSHYRTGSNSHLLKDSAPHWHTQTPDLDKLVRSTLDGLTQAHAIEDDKWVSVLHAAKKYADKDTHPGAIIVIQEA